MITLRDYCGAVYDSTLQSLLSHNIQGSNEEREKFISELSTSFQHTYAELGMPYGASEEDMVRYILENSDFEVSDGD